MPRRPADTTPPTAPGRSDPPRRPVAGLAVRVVLPAQWAWCVLTTKQLHYGRLIGPEPWPQIPPVLIKEITTALPHGAVVSCRFAAPPEPDPFHPDPSPFRRALATAAPHLPNTDHVPHAAFNRAYTLASAADEILHDIPIM